MKAHIGLGSNVGDRVANLAEALRRLDALEHTAVHAVSRAYESEPWGVADQARFANAVAVVETALPADDLLVALKEIESQMGRTPGELNGPRVIDLDILLFGAEEWDSTALAVPHPRMLEREFVVTPLLEVDPDVRMPDGSPVNRERAVHGRLLGETWEIPGFGQGWVAVWERGGYTPLFSATHEPGAIAGSGGGHVSGAVPDMEAGFAQVVLEQLGIDHVWDPFPPDKTSDPYGLSRPFRLLVPAARADEASRAIAEALSAPIDWSGVDWEDGEG